MRESFGTASKRNEKMKENFKNDKFEHTFLLAKIIIKDIIYLTTKMKYQILLWDNKQKITCFLLYDKGKETIEKKKIIIKYYNNK